MSDIEQAESGGPKETSQEGERDASQDTSRNEISRTSFDPESDKDNGSVSTTEHANVSEQENRSEVASEQQRIAGAFDPEEDAHSTEIEANVQSDGQHESMRAHSENDESSGGGHQGINQGDQSTSENSRGSDQAHISQEDNTFNPEQDSSRVNGRAEQWESPLKQEDPQKYDELLQQRGTDQSKLSETPEGWTGQNEADFRGYPAPKEGYHWTTDLSRDDNLRLDRSSSHDSDNKLRPELRYDRDEATFKRTEEYEELCKRRGTEDDKLTAQPEKWTGKDEAKIRGFPEAEPEYHWTFDTKQENNLRYDRESIADSPARYFNEEKGVFENVDTNVVLAKLEKWPEIKLGEIPPATRNKLEEPFQKRLEWGKIKNDTSQTDAIRSTAIAEERAASRKLGEVAADHYMKERYAEDRKAEDLEKGLRREVETVERVYPPPDETDPVSRKGEFDQVWKVSMSDGEERFIVVEAKGGRSHLIDKEIRGTRYQQGTVEYFNDTVAEMANNSDADTYKGTVKRTVAVNLRDAKTEEKVDYIFIEATIVQKNNEDALGNIKVSKFILE